MIEYIQFDFPRIDFDRDLRIGIELEVFAQQLFRYVGVPPPQCNWLT